MRKIAIIVLLSCLPTIANAEYVRGYTRSNGTYVQPHYKTAPDNSMYNNYSTQGNQNPYTGRRGYVDPNEQQFRTQPQPSYYQQQQRSRSSYR